jgi:hypothetical protein
MGDSHRAHCKLCRRHRRECGPISWGGYCGVCGPALAVNAWDQIREHRGPIFRRWREGMAASVGAALDDPPRAA